MSTPNTYDSLRTRRLLQLDSLQVVPGHHRRLARATRRVRGSVRRPEKAERERRPSLDEEEEAAMEAKYEAFKAAKEAAEKEAALRASRSAP